MWNAFSSRIIVTINGKMNNSGHGVKRTDDGKVENRRRWEKCSSRDTARRPIKSGRALHSFRCLACEQLCSSTAVSRAIEQQKDSVLETCSIHTKIFKVDVGIKET